MADFFNAPSVDEVDLSGYSGQAGDPIVIHASDDFAVSAVSVALTNTDGSSTALRQAQGASRKAARPAKARPALHRVLRKRHRWLYTATTAVATGTQVRITVTATDRPGGTGSGEVQKTL